MASKKVYNIVNTLVRGDVVKTHLDLSRELYRANTELYAWDQLPPEEKAEYIYLAERTVDIMKEVLGTAKVHIEIVEVSQQDLQGGCGCT